MNKLSQGFVDIVKRSSRTLGVELQRLKNANTEEAIIKNLFRTLQPTVVLDVGANIGQFATKVRAIGYRGLIISFEALPSVHAQLTGLAKNDSQWLVAPCAALGSQAGSKEMNVSATSASSSLLGMRDVHVRAAPMSAYIRKDNVRVMRLDDSCSQLLPREGRIVLKIDTQGYEREVLLGATELLHRVAAIQLELSLIQLYECSPTLAEMVPFVEDLGFELFNIAPGFKDVRTGRLLQADGFFVRKNATEFR
jgi:FkbM family methyltransferase